MAVKKEESVVQEVAEGACLPSLNAVWQAPVQVAEGRQQNNCGYQPPAGKENFNFLIFNF
jgi:hypothetical protein